MAKKNSKSLKKSCFFFQKKFHLVVKIHNNKTLKSLLEKRMDLTPANRHKILRTIERVSARTFIFREVVIYIFWSSKLLSPCAVKDRSSPWVRTFSKCKSKVLFCSWFQKEPSILTLGFFFFDGTFDLVLTLIFLNF
jgi:hypothetical protein